MNDDPGCGRHTETRTSLTVLPDVAFLRQIVYFFNAYGSEKIELGDVAGFWLCLTWPFSGNGGIYGIKMLTRSATVEWFRYEGKFFPIRDLYFYVLLKSCKKVHTKRFSLKICQLKD